MLSPMLAADDGLEVLIVGGGPAGLSAALVLGRCRRRVLLCDAGRPRNAVSPEVHGYLGVVGASAYELRTIGRQQLAEHPNVRVQDIEVRDVTKIEGGFRARLDDATEVRSRKLLLATGLADEIPELPGLRPLWGKVVFPCPYCDGWEFRGRRLAALALDCDGTALTRALTSWSDDVVLFTNETIDPDMERAFERKQVRIVRAPVLAVEARGDGVRLQLADTPEAPFLDRDAVFLAGPQKQKTSLLARLGCRFTEKGTVDCGPHQSTSVPGLFVAGDAAANIQFAIIAAAEGATAAFAINRELLREDFGVTP
jgi:thioredoxin reductase